PADHGADVIFHNGIILTMDEDLSVAEALAVKDGRIVAVGSEADVFASAGAQTELISLDGRVLMPGFVDAHTHLLNDAGTYGMDLDGVQQMALENGITTLGGMFTTEEFLNEMQDYNAENRLRVHTNLYLIYNTNCGDIVGNWWKDYPPTRVPGEMLRIGGVKIFADGGSCNRPALSYETSPGSGLGDLYLTGEQIAEVVKDAQDVGHQVAIHALGDRAIEAALDGIESALDGGPNKYRHRIEHNAILRPDLLPRYGELDVVATVFGTFPSCVDFKNPSPPPYNEWEWAWDTLLDANPDLHVAWHGDDPYIRPLNPVLELYGLVTRDFADDDRVTICEAKGWIGDNTLSVEQALPMMNRESAYALWRDGEVGMLEPGLFADLIILSHNPMSVDPEILLDTYVLMTMVGGKVEWCAPGSETLCPATPISTFDRDAIPFGYLDSPAAEETISGIFTLFGWALVDGGPIDRVEIYLDGEYIGNAIYGDPRPDVAADYPGREGEPNFGYSFELDTTLYSNGAHTLTAVAVGVSGNEGYLIPEVLDFIIGN
ncbi:MAG TPA: amidohydrolase family protein, partial [Anaerolineales bacterium]